MPDDTRADDTRAGGRRAARIGDVRAAAAEFVRHPSPRLLLAATAAGCAGRAALGRWSRADTVTAGGLVAAYPFVEWTIHVYVLHVRPRGPVSRLADRAAGRSHRAHHADPTDLRLQFIDPAAVVAGAALAAGAVVATGRAPHAVTGAATAAALTLGYEWTHFLIHTDVPPRSAAYRRIWRAHRLHHFRNERYWFGVTSGIADVALGTAPARDAVPVSPTARTAGARARG